MQSQPTVIMVWMQNPLAGLGDLLRGTVHLFELSQQLKFRLIIDTQFHPISKFLLSNSHEYSDYVLQNKNKVIDFINCTDVKQKIENLLMNPNSKTHPLLIVSNNIDDISIFPSIQSNLFIRSFLNPTDDFKQQFNEMCSKFKISRNYSIMHLRLGDNELVHHNKDFEKYKEAVRIIDSNVKPNDNVRIIADSSAFKQYLRIVRPLLAGQIIPTKPVHLSHSTENDAEMIKDTLFDFFLLMNAKFIKTYTTYTWISGFVHWISYAFNVPLISINHSHMMGMNGMNSTLLSDTKTLKTKPTMVFAQSSQQKPKLPMNPNIKSNLNMTNMRFKKMR